MTATVDVGGPFKIETKSYTIAAQVELAEAEEVPSTAKGSEAPEAKPAVAADVAPEAPKAEPAAKRIQVEETPTKEGKKSSTWLILSALVGLGVAAAGFAVFKKSV